MKRFKRGEGSNTRYVGFSISGLSDAEHHQKGYIIIFQDLTRWRRMQEELRMRDRMVAVGELAAGLAHEIGNPLAAISGSIELLSSSGPEQEAGANKESGELMAIVLREVARLDTLITDLLDFARPRQIEPHPIDICAS